MLELACAVYRGAKLRLWTVFWFGFGFGFFWVFGVFLFAFLYGALVLRVDWPSATLPIKIKCPS